MTRRILSRTEGASLSMQSSGSVSTYGWVSSGIDFANDILGLLDIFEQLPGMSNDDIPEDVYNHWQEEMAYFQQLLNGQLDMKNELEKILGMLQGGEDIGQEIINNLENGLSTINDQLEGVHDHIDQMQKAILESLSAFYGAVMDKFNLVQQNQRAMMAQLKLIESLLMELLDKVDRLGAKVDWNGVVSVSGTHIQRIEYMYDCLSHIPPVDPEAGTGAVTELYNYHRLREWAQSVMDYNNGLPLALDALNRVIMGENVLVNSVISLLIKLLQEDAFPQGGHPKSQVVRDYYRNLAMIQIKGFMCVQVASTMLRISNPFEGLIEDRINAQLTFVNEAIANSGFDDHELLPAPTEGEPTQMWYGEPDTVFTLTIDVADPALGLGNPHEWAIVNMKPFIDDTQPGLVEVCLARLRTNYGVDPIHEWRQYTTSDVAPLKIENVARLIKGVGAIQTATVSVPEDRLPTKYIFELDQGLRLKIVHNAYNEAEGVWSDDPVTVEIPYNAGDADNFEMVTEDSITYWWGNPVAVASDYPIMVMGYLLNGTDSKQISFQTSRFGTSTLPPPPPVPPPTVTPFAPSPKTGTFESHVIDHNGLFERFSKSASLDLEYSGLPGYEEYVILNIKPILSTQNNLEICVAKLTDNLQVDIPTKRWVKLDYNLSQNAVWPDTFFFQYPGPAEYRVMKTPVSIPVGRVLVGFSFKVRRFDNYYQPDGTMWPGGQPHIMAEINFSLKHCAVDVYTRKWIPSSLEIISNGAIPSPDGNVWTDFDLLPPNIGLYRDEPVSADENTPLAGLQFNPEFNSDEQRTSISYQASKFIPGE